MTGKTAKLRKIITTQLKTVSGGTYYHRAPEKAATFPYKTFDLVNVDLGDLSRDDYELQVDIWDRATDPKTVDEIADAIEELLQGANLPQASIYPTFYRAMRYYIEDPDRDIQHVQLTFTAQLYTD